MNKRHVRRHDVIQPSDQTIKLIPLTKNQNAIVDAEDYERLNQFNWHTIRNHRGEHRATLYAGRRVGKPGRYIFMHQQVLNNDCEVDHRNHNGLDNRKENLRPCKHSQNIGNARSRPSIVGYKGVYFDSRTGKFQAYAGPNGKGRYLGTFDTGVEAARAYDAAAKNLFGEFAHLNFP